MKVAIILTLIPAILAAAVAEPNANAEAFPEPVAEPGTLMSTNNPPMPRWMLYWPGKES